MLTETNSMIPTVNYATCHNYNMKVTPVHLLALHAKKFTCGPTTGFYIAILLLIYYTIKSRWVLTTLVGLGCR